ncbi:MAG: Tlg2-vesicle protein [Tremellales sp. Tagirdzhanova-0007]|nr:MAG: Tlg2-vesicle protein [Tremellales sp. Tagirdzhanova-0007]
MPRQAIAKPVIAPKSMYKRARSFPRETLQRYHRLSIRSKYLLWGITFLHFFFLGLIIILTPTRIGSWFNSFAIYLRSMGAGGMAILALMVVLASHPPLFGFAGSMTLIGFTYGVWPGFLLASCASMCGAGLSFLSVRAFFLNWVRKQSNDKWNAFGRVMSAKGLPLVIMIRYCPLPWAVGNGLFASIESVKFWHFMLANLLIQPRLLIPVFIGSRLTSLTSETPSHDPLRFWLNLLSIGLSGTISTLTGVWIYRLTLEQMRKMEEGDVVAEALEQGALLGDFSGEDEDAEELDDEPLTGTGGARIERPPRGH